MAATAALLLLVAAAWGREALPGIPDRHPLIYTNAATLLFWVVWFMGLVLLAPLAGRAWCGICPLGFISERLGRVGLNLGWPGQAARNLSVAAVFLAGVGAALFFDAHKSPHLTALTVGGAALLAVISGLVWKRAAFCGFLCPVGTVLSVYSRYSPIRVSPVDESRCAGCRERGCTKRNPSWVRHDAGSLVLFRKKYSSGCPVALDPPSMDAAECLVCLECVRNCSHGNMGVFVGKRTSAGPLTRAGTFLFPVLAGLVVLVLIRTWPELRDRLAPGAFPPQWVWASWFGLVLPLILILGGTLLEKTLSSAAGRTEDPPGPGENPRAGKKEARPGFWASAAVFAAPFAGPVLGAHMAVALVKLNAKIAYLPYLFYDPTGVTTYMAIHVSKTLPLPPMALAMAVVKVLAPALMAAGAAFGARDAALLWKRPLSPWSRLYAWAGFALLTALYSSTLVHWLYAGR